MKALVLGASGATGRQVVRQLIKRQIHTRIHIRETAVLSEDIHNHSLVEIVKGSISELTDTDMSALLQDCTAIISCLGHNITFKGMYGRPRYLVFDAIKRITELVNKEPAKKRKLILMSTTAYTNPLAGEKNSIAERMIFSFLMLILPPHRDNVKAANHLVMTTGHEHKNIDWIAVRPDSLINETEETTYEIYESKVRSPLFNAGKTSRINVSHFMAELVTDDAKWNQWQYKTPVIYNKDYL
ncbi:NAD(P)-binding oxidoreductase [Halobacillus halophilus]|uniref:NAD(P)-binding oxidoreductase n=1 Tax=Halobacillus halophilus TaxID=1570 RepID=UPI001CD49C1E|nr:NAD(P)-binding oxidoreductase [Halobacillus halophilus]MCA1011571.1 SDR family oxidoreductase [Halobacillus halophilus]